MADAIHKKTVPDRSGLFVWDMLLNADINSSRRAVFCCHDIAPFIIPFPVVLVWLLRVYHPVSPYFPGSFKSAPEAFLSDCVRVAIV